MGFFVTIGLRLSGNNCGGISELIKCFQRCKHVVESETSFDLCDLVALPRALFGVRCELSRVVSHLSG